MYLIIHALGPGDTVVNGVYREASDPASLDARTASKNGYGECAWLRVAPRDPRRYVRWRIEGFEGSYAGRPRLYWGQGKDLEFGTQNAPSSKRQNKLSTISMFVPSHV